MIGTNGTFLTLDVRFADATTSHLLAILPDGAEKGAAARYASLMALADFRQTPVTGHASIAFQAAYARFALALSGLWIAGVRNTA